MRRRGGGVASRTRSRRSISPNIASPIDLSVWAPPPEVQPEKRKARPLFKTVLNKDNRQRSGLDVNATDSGPSNGRRLVESGSSVQSPPLDLDGGCLNAQDCFTNNGNIGQSVNAVEVITQDDIPVEDWRDRRDGTEDQRSELKSPREDAVVEWARKSRPTSDRDTSMLLFDREIAFTDDDHNTDLAFNDTIHGIDLECSTAHSQFDDSSNDLSSWSGGRAATIPSSCQRHLSSSEGEDPNRPRIDSSPSLFFDQQSHAETLSGHGSHRLDTLSPHASAQTVTSRPSRLQRATGTTEIPTHLSPHDPPLPLVSPTPDDGTGTSISSALICSSRASPHSTISAVAHPKVSIQSQDTQHRQNHDSATTVVTGVAPVFPPTVVTSTTLSRPIPVNHGNVEGDDREVEDTSLEYALLAQALYFVSL